MLRPDKKCHCGSGRLAQDCCVALEAPVTRTTFNYPQMNLNIDIVAVDPQGRTFRADPNVTRRVVKRNNIGVTMTMKDVAAIDQSIDSALTPCLQAVHIAKPAVCGRRDPRVHTGSGRTVHVTLPPEAVFL